MISGINLDVAVENIRWTMLRVLYCFHCMHETQQPSPSIFCHFNEIKVSFDLFAVLLSDESGVTESHQYEVDESEVWRHHQLQR